MNLTDELDATPPKKAISFPEWLISQEPKIRDSVDRVLRDMRWSDYHLEQTLRRHGAPVSRTSIAKWRADHGIV